MRRSGPSGSPDGATDLTGGDPYQHQVHGCLAEPVLRYRLLSSSAMAFPGRRHRALVVGRYRLVAPVANLATPVAPPVTTSLWAPSMLATAQVLNIRAHHRVQRFYAGGQTEASEAGVHSLPRFFHAGRDGERAWYGSSRDGVAFPQGIDTRSLRARGEQRRRAYFNIDRDLPSRC